MKFSGLSENQILKIKAELDKSSTPYRIEIDQDTIDSNRELSQNPIQYLNPGLTSSSDILSIVIEDNDLEELSEPMVKKLNDLDIYWGKDPFDSHEKFEEIIPPKKIVDRQILRIFFKSHVFIILIVFFFYLIVRLVSFYYS